MSTEKNILLNRLKRGAQTYKTNPLFIALVKFIEAAEDNIYNDVNLLSSIISAKKNAESQQSLSDEPRNILMIISYYGKICHAYI